MHASLCRRLLKPNVVRRSLLDYIGSDSKELLHNPNGVRMGWSRDVISNFLPFTSELITIKGRAYENIAVGYCPQVSPQGSTDDFLGNRRTDDAWLEIILPFSDHPDLRDTMVRSDRKSVRYGKLFEILDALAGDVAYRHCGGRSHDLTIVTTSVDGMSSSSAVDVNHDVKLQGYITYTGKSSMEVTIDIISVSSEGKGSVVGHSKFIMVARGSDGKSRPVYGLLLANEKAKAKFQEGKLRTEQRKARAATSLAITPPKPEEISLIHTLFLESRNLKTQKDLLMQRQLKQFLRSLSCNVESGTLQSNPGSQTFTAANQEQGFVDTVALLSNVRFKWMKHTIFKSAQQMHHQDRNVHGKIFGGYLMYKAFDLAWVAAVCFIGEKEPKFLYVDDIQFVKPVNIGSVMEFTSTVIYSHDKYVVVQVVAAEVNVVDGSKHETNILTYVFRSVKSSAELMQYADPLNHSQELYRKLCRRSMKRSCCIWKESAH